MDREFNKQSTVPDLSIEEKPIPCPTKIGPYKIESPYAKGGMSILYLGVHPETTKPLIIKVLSPRFIRNKEVIDRFLKEAQIIAMASHPNIVKLYGQGEWEKGLYIAMEFIQGISLRQFIEQASLSRKRALEIIIQVAYALSHLHTHGIIHRDLKPENILITETGDPKVIDFGISQLKTEKKAKHKTSQPRIIGTPVYMSPEQKEDPSNVTFSSDIYSLGLITYELIMGKLSHGHIHLHLLPKGIKEIVQKALQPNPEERYQSIVDFITDISEYLKNYTEKEFASEHIINTLAQTQELFFPKEPPLFRSTDIGLASPNGMSLSGIYGDFFKLPQGELAVILAEPTETGVNSLVSASFLKGMIRTLFENSLNANLDPITFISLMNRLLARDKPSHTFKTTFLLLHPESEKMTLIGCGGKILWQLPVGSETLSPIATSNPKLGVDENASFVEITLNWNVGDRLILHSENHLSEHELKKNIEDTLYFPPHIQAQKLQQMFHAPSVEIVPEKSPVVIVIERIC